MKKENRGRASRLGQIGSYIVAFLLLFILPRAAAAEVTLSVQGLGDLVSISVLVTDETGTVISDLRHEDFEIIENGSVVSVEEFQATAIADAAPMSIVFVMDYSVSLIEGKAITAVEDAVINFIDRMMEDDRFAIVKFGKEIDAPEGFLRVGDLTPEEIEAEVRRDPPSNPWGSPIYDSIKIGLDLLHGDGDLPAGPKALLLLSDGHDTTSAIVRTENELHGILSSSYPVYPIGFTGVNTADACDNNDPSELCVDINVPVLTRIADTSGTAYYHGENAEELEEIHSQIHERIANEYILRYASAVSFGDCSDIHLTVNVAGQSGETLFSRCFPEVPPPDELEVRRGSGGGSFSPLGLLVGLLCLTAWRVRRAAG